MKKLLFITAFLMFAGFGFSQGKGKSKSKNNAKTQTTVPAPQGNPTKLPEVKEKPKVYHQKDSTKNPSGQQGKEKDKSKNGKENKGKDSSNFDNSNKENWDKEKKQKEGKEEDDDKNGKEKVKNKDGKENEDADDDSDKNQSKNKQKEKGKKNENGNSKVRTNIPTQVKNSFNSDYPNARDAVWTKQQGDWTVNFRNNAFRSTATYHSNGERVDTRTSMPSQQAPAPVLGEIQKRFPQANPKDIIKIEKPKNPNLFQVMINEGGKIKTILFDEKGKLVSEQ